MNKKVFWILILSVLLLAACQTVQTSSPPTAGIVSGRICFPSDYIPEMNLFFQPVGEDRVITYPVLEGQAEYSLELAPGTYHAYLRLPEDILGGGMYSEAVPCGLEVGCGHQLLPVVVEAGQETGGVDVCDWYAPPGEVPLPPGLIEGLIVRYWQGDHPDFSGESSLVLEELPMDGQLITKLSVRLFRVVEGPLESETFLIRYDGLVIRLGQAEGGQGVSSLAISDLDQDGTSELYYSYSFGSGIHQSRIGVYVPAISSGRVYEADLSFNGDLGLFSDQPGQVGVRAVQGDPETMTITYLDTLGYLRLGRSEGQLQLVLDQVDDLPEEILDLIVLPNASAENENQLWRTVEDTHHGVRFAVPCFWEVGLLDPPPPTEAFGYPVRNYSERYVDSLGKDKSPLWEGGGIKIDMNFLSGSDWNLSPDATPKDLLAALYGEDSNLSVLDVENEVINGQEGFLVTAEDLYTSESQFYLFKVSDRLFLLFGPRTGTLDHPDVQGVLHSLALTPDAEVKIPGIVPQDPLDGMTDSCLEDQSN